MRAVWTPEALSDRREVWDYIASENPQAATAMDALFSDAVARLIDYPSLGRPGQVSGTRELIAHDHYRLVYEIELDTVWILALVHTSKQWPPIWNR